jgi:chloramphenicol 3-O phosphotransferase
MAPVLSEAGRMEPSSPPGWIVVLNGAPRSGKSSIVEAVQETLEGAWMNLGVDVFGRSATPRRFKPGIGLRPGADRPEIETLVPALYAALFDSVAAHSRLGLNVVADVGIHDAYSSPLHILRDAARRLENLPALLVGVRCPVDVVMQRRDAGHDGREGEYATSGSHGEVPESVLSWEKHVHSPGIYDLEIDTSVVTPHGAAKMIDERLDGPRFKAFDLLADRG